MTISKTWGLFSVQTSINVLKMKFHVKKELRVRSDGLLTVKKHI